MDLVSNDWKPLLRTEAFYYNNKCNRKIKDFQKFSNKKSDYKFSVNSLMVYDPIH